jgi:succinyl-diaminopimelate desuccinylase
MKDRLIKHLSMLVSFYPVSTDQRAVKSLLNYCLEIIETSGAFSDAKILNNKDIYSLYASTKGTKRPSILLNGHVDVVAATKSQQTIRLKGSIAYGRGTLDDLFATAMFLTLIEELRTELKSIDIGIMLTGDEELGGSRGVGTLVEEEYLPSISIMPDAGEGFGDINTGCRGIYNFELNVKGKSHHGSRPWDGDGAANKLIALLSELIGLTSNKEDAKFTVVTTKLAGGDSITKAPNSSSAHVDIRYQEESDLAEIKDRLSYLCKKYNAQITQTSAGQAFNLDLGNPLVKDFMELYQKKAGEITFSKTTGSSDARFFAAKNIPVIMIRPQGGNLHGDDEWVNVAELEKTYNLIKEYLLKVAKI